MKPLSHVAIQVDGPAPRLLGRRIAVADRWWPRFRGMQFRAGFAPDDGLLLLPCSSVHTHWMRFELDIICLDRAGGVLQVRSGVRPWRFVIGDRSTHAILELPSGGAAVRPGERLVLAMPPNAEIPPSLQFLNLAVDSAAS